MKNSKKGKRSQKEDNPRRSKVKKGLVEIGQKLGIAIPAGLLLLSNQHADASTKKHVVKETFETTQALKLLRRYIEQSPDSPFGYYGLARVFARDNRIDQALFLYEKALRLSLDVKNKELAEKIKSEIKKLEAKK